MRNLLAFLAVVVIAALALGSGRGWYTVHLLDAEAGKSAFRVEIDRTKIGTDFLDGARTVQRTLNTEPKEAQTAE